MNRKIILPGDPEFDLTLSVNLPPDWRQIAHNSGGHFASIARAESGVLEAASHAEIVEYLNGGEYDQRLSEIEGDEFEDDDFLDDWECGEHSEHSPLP